MKLRGSSLRWLLFAAPLFVTPLACSLLVESALSDKPLGEAGASSVGGAGGSGAAGAGGTGGAAPCGGPCSGALSCCADQCVDLKSDEANCGACGKSCTGNDVCCDGVGCVECCTAADCPTADHLCNANKCVLSCKAPEVPCSTECADLMITSNHCGSCSNDCLVGHECAAGACLSGWASMSQTGAPNARQHASATWTGSRLFVWGGQDALGALGDGGLYDPASDSWTPISITNAPTARADASAVTVGSKVVVWGGGPTTDQSALAQGSIYDPSSDTWTAIADAPIARRQAAAVSTGDQMLIWGGLSSGSTLAGGALYDPAANKWTQIAAAGAPTARSGSAFVWANVTKEFLLFGGRIGATATSEGFAYSPSTNKWRTLAVSPLVPRYDSFALMIGDRFFVFGGRDAGILFDDAASYDPVMDVWTSAASLIPQGKRAAPFGRSGWVGLTPTRALFVGGIDTGQKLKTDGVQYDPMMDLWPDVIPPFPSAVDHEYGVGVWSGAEIILWSGLENNVLSPVGERYRP